MEISIILAFGSLSKSITCHTVFKNAWVRFIRLYELSLLLVIYMTNNSVLYKYKEHLFLQQQA